MPNLHVHLQSILVENTLMVVVGVLIALEGRGDVRSRPRPCRFTVSLEITGVTRRVGRFSYRITVKTPVLHGEVDLWQPSVIFIESIT